MILISLEPYQEYVGDLIEVKCKDNRIKLLFQRKEEVEIPKDALMIEDLTKCKGSRIGVFNCSDGRYLFRKIWKQNQECDIFKGEFGTIVVPKEKKKKLREVKKT